ncbi:response regulator [Cohnella sp.]|uniref:response regulator transcription factor n=1 Tax=Cohnella sp. TaxID=1883426 RepID=UPI00356249F9
MKHILIADDEPLILKGLVAILKQHPYPFGSIRTATNGEKALQMIGESIPHLLFTDIRMPRMDGLELCRAVHEKYPTVEKVIISGYGDFEYAQACISYGVKEYLLKPFTPSKIHALLQKMLSRGEVAFSISRYEEFVEQIVDGIWALDDLAAQESLERWESYCKTASASDADYVRMLSDGLPMVHKRLTVRGFRPKPDEAAEPREAGKYFGHVCMQISRLIEDLALQRGGQDLMQKAKAYIDERITQELSLEDVADFLGITPPYLSLLFKKVYKETFVQYRIGKRMLLAKRLLEIPHYRTHDIAYEVGYENYPHFSRTFKKVTGLSPLEYRHAMGIK